MAKREKNKKPITDQQEIELSNTLILGAYSIDDNGDFQNDLSALKYIKKTYWNTPQDVNFNLKEIYESMKIVARPHNYLERLKSLTRFIQENPENIIKNKKVDADFVCFRGVLKYVLASFYCHQGWIVEAVKLKGTIYMALITNCLMEPIDYLTIFENCIVTSDSNKDSVTVIKPSASEFRFVMSKKINDIKLLFGGECDAIISDEPVESLDDLRNSKLIEIKSRCDKSRHYMDYFRDYKKLHWWCQSSIASIDTIYLGKRDENDIVKTIEKIDVESLENPEKSQTFWDKNVCLHRLREFLRNVQVDMEDVNDPRTVYRYEWKERFTTNWKNQYPMFPDIIEDRGMLSEDYVLFINNL
ncbi:hypothetical protein ACKWTF_013076 [Chironomus riparius]